MSNYLNFQYFRQNSTRTFLVFALTLFYQITFGQSTYTAASSGTWGSASVWTIGAIADGDADGIPDANDNVIIPDGFTVSLSAARTCDSLVINFGGILLFNGYTFSYSNNAAFIDSFGGEQLYITQDGGNWNAGNSWINNDVPADASSNVFIAHSINARVPATISGYITVSSEGRLEDNGIDIGGAGTSILVDGTLTTTSNDLGFTSNKTVRGTGILGASGQIDLNANTLTIASSSDLLFQPTVEGGSTGTIENNGSAAFSSGLQNVNFNNNSNAYTQFQNSNITTSFTLDASASGNTVDYAFTDAAATIINTTYYNLSLSTSGGNTFSSTTDVNGNLTVNAATTVSTGITLNVGGNWLHNSGVITITGSTVEFDGTGDQSISSAPLSTVSFENLTTNKSSGAVTTSESVQVNNTLNMTQGNIVLNETKLTVGTGTGTAGTLSYTAGFIVGQYEKWVGSTGSYKFPLGNTTSSRILDITFNTGFIAGSLITQFTASAPGTSGLSGGLDVNSTTIYNTFSEGYWTLTPANSLASSDFDVVAEAGDFDSFEFDDSNDARLIVRTATDWTVGGQTSGSADHSSSPKTVSGNAFNPFSTLDLAIGSALNCTAVDANTISGTTSVCTDDIESYSVTQAAGTGTSEFSWLVTGGGLISEYSTDGLSYTDITDAETLIGSNYRFIRIVWPATGTASASVIVSEKASGCGYGASSTLDVTVGTVPPSGIEGRTVVAEGAEGIIYSLQDSIPGYTYTWSVTNGTIVGSNSGIGLDSIFVNWGAVTGTQTVSVVAEDAVGGCTTASAVSLIVNVYNVIDSEYTSGGNNWDRSQNWESEAIPETTESARIVVGDVITLTGDETIRNLIVNGTLDLAGNTLTVDGDIEIYGKIIGAGTVVMSETSSDIVGSSAEMNIVSFALQNNNTILGGSSLIITGDMAISSGASVTNKGSITLTGNVTGGDVNSTWTNAAGTTTVPTSLSVSGEILATGTLQTDALYNTMSYTGTGTTIKTPSSNIYHNLVISNTRSSSAALTINGDLTASAGTLNFGGAITLSGTEAQAVDLTGATIQTSGVSGFPSLTFNNSAGVTLNSALTIVSTGTLTLSSGVVNTGANILTIENTSSAAIVGTGSEATHINGILNRSTASNDWYNFPMGTGTDFKRVEVQPVTTNPHNFQAQSFNTSYGNTTLDESSLTTSNGATVSTIEYWNISRTSGSDGASLRLHWDDSGESGIVAPSSDLEVAHWTGSAWESVGGTPYTGYVESGLVTSFSPFTFVSPSGTNPLPVEFTSFTAEQEQEKVNLKWATASEKNNSHFIVEHSTDGRDFRAIGEVEGGGNSTLELQYEFADHSPAGGSNFYRLRQVDYDGVWDYSRIVHLLYTVTDEDLINVYPNPVKDQFTVELLKEAIGPVSISLFNQLGRRVQMWNFKEGGHVFENHIGHKLKAGVYTVKILRSGMLPAATKIIVE